MVNGSDSVRGRLFSLLHEYVHLLLHTGGLCDTVTDTRATDPDRALEARCNAIAAAMLMPRNAVLSSAEVVRRCASPDSGLRKSAGRGGAEFLEAYEREERQTPPRR